MVIIPDESIETKKEHMNITKCIDREPIDIIYLNFCKALIRNPIKINLWFRMSCTYPKWI